MYYNYIKIAWRNLWKNKLFSFLNIMGLGIAIPFVLLSLLQLQAAFEFDNFHPDGSSVYRICTNENFNGRGVIKYASSPFLLSDQLRGQYPCVEKSTKVVREFGWEMNTLVKYLKVNMIYVEPAFFEMFGFPLASGVMPKGQNELVIAHEAAQKFFSDLNPIGQTLSHPNYGVFKITGVLKPFKKGTQFRSDVMVSMATYLANNPEATSLDSWAKYEAHTFVRLYAKSSPENLDQALNDFAKKQTESIPLPNKTNQYYKQALADISPSLETLRFNPYVDNWDDIAFNFFIPLLILMLAAFNYINLTLARSLNRSREVGIRKVVGAKRHQLLFQFICEAILIALFALALGLVILSLMQQFIHVQWVTWEVENQFLIYLSFTAFTLILGIISGIMPAWILSSFQPLKVLKGTLVPASFGKVSLRKSLTIIQFVVTMGFVFMMSHMYNQFEYMATENENFNRKNIFNLSIQEKSHRVLIDELSKNKNIERIGCSSKAFGSTATEYAISRGRNDDQFATYYYAVDRSFIENMNLKILAGQNLPESNSDSASHFVLVNEKAIAKLGLGTAQEAIGKEIFLQNSEALQIVGVVKDFCHFNYQFQKEPLLFQYNPAAFQLASIKMIPDVAPDVFLADMQTIWKKHYPFQEMIYSWYEKELFDRYYPAEEMKMMGLSSMVILVIAMMGLLGIVTYSTEKRFREVSIRKVMGASVLQIAQILSWEFMKLLLIAGSIALPIGYFSGLWFTNFFTFHPPINFTLMSISFGLVLAAGILTVGYYAVKAALVNPVESLRSE